MVAPRIHGAGMAGRRLRDHAAVVPGPRREVRPGVGSWEGDFLIGGVRDLIQMSWARGIDVCRRCRLAR